MPCIRKNKVNQQKKALKANKLETKWQRSNNARSNEVDCKFDFFLGKNPMNKH